MVWRARNYLDLCFIHLHGKFNFSDQRCSDGVNQVLSSIIAAWSDVSSALSGSIPVTSSGISMISLQSAAGALRGLNIGYIWMFTNCLTSAAYVSTIAQSLSITALNIVIYRFFPCARG